MKRATVKRRWVAAPRQTGFTLVEIMIALVLGLVIIAALGQLYAGSRQSYALSEAMTRLNENGRFAVDFLANDIRMAGYLSCGGSAARVGNSVNAASSWIYQTRGDQTRGVLGYEGGVSTPPTEFTGQYRSGTDILVLRRASLDLTRSVIQDDSAGGVLKLGLDHGFKSGEVLVIANPSCNQVSLFRITGLLNLDHPLQGDRYDAIAHGTGAGVGPGNCTSALFGTFDCTQPAAAESGVFRPGSVVSRFAVNAYYVTATDPPTLVRQRLTQMNAQPALITEELVRDVENFQVLYGRDTVHDGSHRVDDYVTANQVTDWTEVVSIRFALLLRSREDTVRTQAASVTYTLLPGVTASPAADRRLRRVFGAVVALRNNLP